MRLQTACGTRVTYNKDHLAAHASVLHLLPDALKQVDMSNATGVVAIAVDMKRVVGVSGCVLTTADDEIVHEYRPGRRWPSRVAVNRTGEPTTTVTVVAVKRRNRVFLITAYCGSPAPREVGDPSLASDEEAMKESIQFWSTHALVTN